MLFLKQNQVCKVLCMWRIWIWDSDLVKIYRVWMSPPLSIFVHEMLEPRMVTTGTDVPLSLNDITPRMPCLVSSEFERIYTI